MKNNKLNSSANKNSEYAEFHFAYIGYDFQSNLTRKIMRKAIFWDAYRELAKKTMDRMRELNTTNIKLSPESEITPIAPEGFTLVKRSSFRINY